MRRIAGPVVLAVIFAGLATAEERSVQKEVRFDADVRPILADKCFGCHGPDSVSRKADLRLDVRESLFESRSGVAIVEPGRPESSELYRRISVAELDGRMPPTDSGKSLTNAEIAILRSWIEQGAHWEGHWSFSPPERPPLPEVSDTAWPRNAIDRFVLSALESRGWMPSREASPETLIRRATLDLTGLPPSVAEIDEFLSDSRPGRYERLIDHLLASPRYGEHMAVVWLDAARYADTSGYQTDGVREMWRWRDWLIDTLNAGTPFDQFTVEQLAGDLLPNATLEQRIATGFNRNHRGNSEGGSIPEEFLVEYVADRVETTATAWLGLTIGCARCHDHKYDPISQRDYYRLFAYFHNVPESGRALKLGNSPPFIKAPTAEQQKRLAELDRELALARQRWDRLAERREAAQRSWESLARTSSAALPPDWTIADGLVARYPLCEDLAAQGLDQHPAAKLSTGEPIFITERPALRLGDGRFVEAGDVGRFGYLDSFSISAWIRGDAAMTGGIVSRMSDDSDADGWAFHLQEGRLQVNLVKRWLDDALRIETARRLDPGRWYHVLMMYDGSRVADGVQIYVDGEPQEKVVVLDLLNQTFANDQPLRIGSTGTQQPFTGDLADVRIYQRVLDPEEVRVVSVAEPLDRLIRLAEDERTVNQAVKIREYFLVHAMPPELKSVHENLESAEREWRALHERIPTTMVMQEMESPRPTFVLDRGSYEHPTEPVTAGVPTALGGSKVPNGGNRLALAQWIVDPENPLAARVAVNREWQRFFGTGLVKTAEDFGTQGERPSHPELLDWLATEFVRSDWDVKALQRLIVTSATYRQASEIRPEYLEADPENRLLARGPRFRMTAEMIRDRALTVSGLLDGRIGGESVRPYQIAGLWSKIATDTEYEQSIGPDLYRRSLYSFCKRTVANPTMSLFDATTREACLVRRSRTNTPLQALALMNDVTYVEAARVLAERILRESGQKPEGRMRLLIRLALARSPDNEEVTVLTAGLARNREHYARNPQAAAELICIGDSTADPTIDPVELAAWTAVASVLINLDEFVTKE